MVYGEQGPERGQPAPTGGSGWSGRLEGLSERESQVVVLCADGLSNREIAEALFINIETVRTHLKRAYQRLGVRNRAQVAAYIHQMGAPPPSAPGPGVGTATRAPAAESRAGAELAVELGVDEQALAERRHLLGLSPEARQQLALYHAAAVAGSADFAQALMARWRSLAPTALHLTDEQVRLRLVEHQVRYLGDLFGADYDLAHAEAMLRTGATHHRLRVSPQWYIGSCVHLVCDHLDVVFELAPDPTSASEVIVTLIGSILFDASLVLDGYEMCVERDARRTGFGSSTDLTGPYAPTSADRPPAAPPPTRPSHVRLSLGPDDADIRRQLIELDDDGIAELHGLAPLVSATVPQILNEFYDLLAEVDSTAALVGPEAVDRLLQKVDDYWIELVTGTFDEAYAASRLRVGVIHERIGLTPQLYLTGMARQAAGFIRAMAASDLDLRSSLEVFLRAVFFDLTFVIDAYLEARAESLLQIGRFAGQLVVGLANGVAVVDARNRVEYANSELLDMIGMPAGLLHRLPVASAMPIDGIGDLIAEARASISGRVMGLFVAYDRRLRVTAIRLQRSINGREGLLAIVVDDVSDIMRISAGLDHESRRVDHLLMSIDAVVWELSQEELTMLAASGATVAVLGMRDVDLIGRRTLIDRIHDDDRDRFTGLCRSLGQGERAHLEHRIRRYSDVRRFRTSMVAVTAPSGMRTVCGVTVEAYGPAPSGDATPGGPA